MNLEKTMNVKDFNAEQIGVRCSLVRGGSSKGAFFLEHDLPPAGEQRDKLLKRIMGTPDVMQIDGLGGTHLITSKIAIVGRATVAGADLDYTFAQAEVVRDVIDYSGNCGNISAGVGPFAIDAGLVRPVEPITEVRIHNTNTGKIIVAHVPVKQGRACIQGDLEIAGVPGTGAEIFMDYRLTVGAKTAKVLPTGKVTEFMKLEDGRDLEVTICDVANTIVFVRAPDIGLRGDELPDDINGNAQILSLLREIRGKAATRLGFVTDWEQVDAASPFLPFVVFVSPPSDYTSYSRKAVKAENMDLKARLIFMNNLHEAMAGTGSMCIAAASRIRGSIVNQALGKRASEGSLSIGHPNGIMHVVVQTQENDSVEGVDFVRLGFPRTARKIMDGIVYVPRYLLD
jgi:2-methylaconitate cis-trans-isomerase PrpF